MAYASFRDYLSVVRHERVLVLVAVLLFGGGAFAYSQSLEERYRAEASIACQAPTQDIGLIGLAPSPQQEPEERAAVCAEQAGQRSVMAAVERELDLPQSVASLENDYEARAEVRTNLVVLTVENTDPKLAARIANEAADVVVDRATRDEQERYDRVIRSTRREYRAGLQADDPITNLQRQEFEEQLIRLRTARDFSRPVKVSEPASAPTDSFSPKVIRNTVLGVGAGLLIGLVLAFTRAALDRRLRGSREIEAEAHTSLLATVSESSLGKVNLGDPEGRGTAELDLEPFRILHTNLDYMNPAQPPRRVLVTSASPDEGKSTVAASLAVAAGLAGRRVLLVEADMRRPVLARWLGIDGGPGLADHIAGRAAADEVIRAFALTPGSQNGAEAGDHDDSQVLSVITAGTLPPRPAELIRSPRFADFAATASRAYDLVILDSPPLLPVTDSLDLVQHAEAIVLCVRSNQTTRDELRAALGALGRLPERPVGIVATGVSAATEGTYGYYRYSYAQQGG